MAVLKVRIKSLPFSSSSSFSSSVSTTTTKSPGLGRNSIFWLSLLLIFLLSLSPPTVTGARHGSPLTPRSPRGVRFGDMFYGISASLGNAKDDGEITEPSREAPRSSSRNQDPGRKDSIDTVLGNSIGSKPSKPMRFIRNRNALRRIRCRNRMFEMSRKINAMEAYKILPLSRCDEYYINVTVHASFPLPKSQNLPTISARYRLATGTGSQNIYEKKEEKGAHRDNHSKAPNSKMSSDGEKALRVKTRRIEFSSSPNGVHENISYSFAKQGFQQPSTVNGSHSFAKQGIHQPSTDGNDSISHKFRNNNLEPTVMQQDLDTGRDNPRVVPPDVFRRSKRQINAASNNPEDLLFSCKSTCGEKRDLPCSCGPACLVLHNCCENFEADCPHTAREGREKFAKLLQVETTCTPYDLLVITSCHDGSTPPPATTLPPPTTVPPTTTTPAREIEPQTDQPADITAFINARTPIYDKYSKLVFLNESIFQCNKFPESEGVRWGAIKVIDENLIADLINNTISINQFNAAIIGERAPYHFAPFSKENRYGGPNCLHQAKGSCPSGLLYETTNKMYGEKCQNLLSYVICNTVVYANYYCMKCSSLFNEVIRCQNVVDASLMRTQNPNGLSLLLSISDDKMTVEVDGPSASQPQWGQMSCSLDDCHITGCPTGYRLNEQKKCTRRIFAAFKLWVRMEPSPHMLVSLEHFLVCKYRDIKLVLLRRPEKSLRVQMTDVNTIIASVEYFDDHRDLDKTAVSSFLPRLKGVLESFLAAVGPMEVDDPDAPDDGAPAYCPCENLTLECEPSCEADHVLPLNPGHYNHSSAASEGGGEEQGGDEGDECISFLLDTTSRAAGTTVLLVENIETVAFSLALVGLVAAWV